MPPTDDNPFASPQGRDEGVEWLDEVQVWRQG